MRTLLALLTLSLPALAAEPAEPDAPAAPPTETAAAPAAPERDPASIEISLVGGAHFPQLVNKLGTSFDGMLRLGYAPPILSRRLQIFADLGYSQPPNKVTGSDPRLDGGSYSSTLVVHDLSASLGLKFFLLPTTGTIVPYAGAGLRVHFLRTDVSGTGATAFGQYKETATQVGGVFLLGAGFHLGPGWVLAEADFGYAPVDQRVTGTTNIGALSILLGYGLLF